MQEAQNTRNGNLYLSDGAIELLKWVALVLMTGDHINKYLLDEPNTLLFSLGRLVLPIFVFVLAYNLTRPNVTEINYIRAIKRMLFFGLLATPAFIFIGGDIAIVMGDSLPDWKVLNILFTLALLTGCLLAFEKGQNKKVWLWLGWLSFALLGAFVEYFWGALGLGVTVWWYYKNSSETKTRLVFLLSILFLFILNQANVSFLIAFPLIYIASKCSFKVPRMKWFFYVYYPAHLTVIYAVKVLT